MAGPYPLRQLTGVCLLCASKLGWPTANLDPAAFESTLDSEEEGVYVGWATIEGSQHLPPAARAVHKAVLSCVDKQRHVRSLATLQGARTARPRCSLRTRGAALRAQVPVDGMLQVLAA